MSPELKQTLLALLERARVAVEAEDRKALQETVVEALAMFIQIYGADLPGLLPMMILGKMP